MNHLTSFAPAPAAGSRALQVREARATDSAEILRIREAGARLAFAACSDPDLISELAANRADPGKLAEELADPDCHLLVATRDGRVVGTAALDVKGGSGEMSACACIVRRQGIGSALMRARLDLARRLGLAKVWLEADTVNPEGIAHARRHGFTAVASRPGMRIPGNRVVRYERLLPREPRDGGA